MGLLRKYALPIIAFFVIAFVGAGAITQAWWGPKINFLVDRVLGAEDRAASSKIEADGANDTVVKMDEVIVKDKKAKASTDNAIRSSRASPAATAYKLPADSAARLRAADVELCKLGVACRSDEVEPRISESSPAPAPTVNDPPVRAVRPSDRGNDIVIGS